jgi:HEPN domain-containing protein
MLLFFESTLCLIEAVHLLHQEREAGEKKKPAISGTSDKDATNDPLASILSVITRSMEAEKVFLLGTHPAKDGETEHDLLVLLKDTHSRPLHEYESLVVNRCEAQGLRPVTISVYKLSLVNHLLAQGSLFFSQVCTPDKLVYDAGNIPLNKPAEISRQDLKEQARQQFDSLQAKAKGFLAGARYYQQSGNPELAAFLLHQAAEHSLNALLVPMMGFRLQTHNLRKLLAHCRRFTGALQSIFPEDTDQEIRLFSLLQKAYIHARYNDSFPIGPEEVEILGRRVEALQEEVKGEFEDFLIPTFKLK